MTATTNTRRLNVVSDKVSRHAAQASSYERLKLFIFNVFLNFRYDRSE